MTVFESLVDFVSGSPWTYAAVFGIAALDAVLPLVPSETAVITAGVIAASGDLIVPLVILVAALGAMLGDNVSYLGGQLVGRRGAKRIFRGDRGRRSLAWAERTLDRRGGLLLVVARFIPGGRTAATFTAGVVSYPWKTRFLPFDALGATFWAAYSALLGYFGGEAFEQSPWKGLILAFAIAAGVAIGVEGLRWIRRRRKRAQTASVSRPRGLRMR